MRFRRFGARMLLTPVLLTLGCAGSTISDPPGTGSNPGGPDQGADSGTGPDSGAGPSGNVNAGVTAAECKTPSPGTAPLRRLSNAEYRNTLTDLFAGVPEIGTLVARATADFPNEAESLGFRNNAAFLTVQPLLAQKYLDAAELIAEKAAAVSELLPCAPEAGAELECARTFIQDFGARAYRRALTDEESERFEAKFQEALTSYDFATGVEWFLFSVLQSPSFLYRVETGVGRLTGSEMASRLSYLFWQSLPDVELTRAAENGELESAEGVEQWARRLLSDPRSERVYQYFAEWLDLDRLPELSRDEALFSELEPELPALMATETRAFVQAILGREDGSLRELLTAPYTYANARLARHYGYSGVKGEEFVRVEVPTASGILTQAMLAVQDKPYRTSIVRRGLKVRTDLLCQNVPAPPNNVALDLDSLSADLTQRERLEQHRKDPNCSSCHQLLDPVGIVFENYDAVGRYRTHDENGEPIVTATEITATRDANGPVANVQELGALLAESSDVRECYVKQSFRFFFGREVEAADACSMARLNERFREKGESLSELLVGLTQTDAFLYRKGSEQ